MALIGRSVRASLMLAVAVVPFMGCSLRTNRPSPVDVMQGPAPVRSSTPMENALDCMKQNYPKGSDLRIGVGEIVDGTGQMLTGDSNSRALTQRPDMMMVIGLSKTGVRQVNRGSLSVAEWELKQAMEKRLGDGQRVQIDNKYYDYRPVTAGKLLGSTHYVTGAITELNWNVKSKVAEIGVGGAQIGSKVYHISIAIDLVVTDTLTTEIVLARSYNKQLVGDEYAAGLYRFFDVGTHGQFGPFELFELNIGDKMNEPTQTALRWMFEVAAYDIVGELTGLGETCNTLLPPGTLGRSEESAAEALEPPSAPAKAASVPVAPKSVPTQTIGVPVAPPSSAMPEAVAPVEAPPSAPLKAVVPYEPAPIAPGEAVVPYETAPIAPGEAIVPYEPAPSVPAEAVSIPAAPASVPDQPTSIMVETPSAPAESPSLPAETPGAPVEPTSIMVETPSNPVETAGFVDDTKNMPVHAVEIPAESLSVPAGAVSVPDGTASTPARTSIDATDSLHKPDKNRKPCAACGKIH